MTAPFDLTDDQLADALRDLGTHLDLGPSGSESGRADLVAAVLAALPDAGDEPGVPDEAHEARPPRRSGGGRRARLLAAAAIVLVAGLAVVTVAPAREAVARWLGVGGVRIERTEHPPSIPTSTTPAASPVDTAPTLPDGSVDVAALAARLPFVVRLPAADVAGEPISAEVDAALASGLIEVRYPGFTLVELASQPGGIPALAKSLGPGTTTTPVTVAGESGLWITGEPHQLAFVGPDGEIRRDRIRRAGDVLLWEADGVTHRIEGAPSLDDALAIADSLR